MREDLEQRLFKAWPDLYRLRKAKPSRMNSFDHGNGWYGIVDVLSAEITALAHRRGLPVPAAFWSKEKFGGLRWSLAEAFGDDEADEELRGMINAAESTSASTCESTGAPGCLWNLSGCYNTASREWVEAWLEGRKREGHRFGKKQTLHFLMDEDKQRRNMFLLVPNDDGSVLADSWNGTASGLLAEGGRADVPRGVRDLALVMLYLVKTPKWDAAKKEMVETPSSVVSLNWNNDQGFLFSCVEDHPGPGVFENGILRICSAMAKQVDRETGAWSIPTAPSAA